MVQLLDCRSYHALAIAAYNSSAVQHWGEIAHWLQGVWTGIASFFGWLWGVISGFFVGVGKWFADRFNEAYKGVTGAFGAVGKWFGDRVHDIQNVFGGIGNIVQTYLVQPFLNGLSAIGGVFSAIGKLIGDATTFNWGAIPGDLHGLHIPGFASGVENFIGGAALVGEKGPELVTLPRGASVMNAVNTASLLGNNRAPRN